MPMMAASCLSQEKIIENQPSKLNCGADRRYKSVGILVREQVTQL